MAVAELITLTNSELTRFFFALVLLLGAAHTVGYLFHAARLPRVIGEITGGLLLGPTVLGFVAPQAYEWIFNAFEAEGKLIAIIYWIGLVLLMFLSGFELEKSFSRGDRRIIAAILVGATVLPLIAGWLAPHVYDFSPFIGPAGNMLALQIVIAIAVAVTSIPVISKIFIDLGIVQSRFAKVVLATATVQDVILWVALAIATGLVSGQGVSAASIVTTVLVTLAFFAVALLLMPRVLAVMGRLKANILLRSSAAGYVLLICFLFAAAASVLNVNVVFGAFLAGIVLGQLPKKQFSAVKGHIREIALAFFIPVYFAVVGLKLDLVHYFDLWFFLGFLLFTTVFEAAGTLLAARLARLDWLSSANLAVAMNTRGGPGIILASVAFDMGIINETFFATLVLVAIVTSLAAGYWFRLVLARKWPLLRG